MKNIFLQFNIYINIPSVDVLLPVGISFYTFQALSYTIDVYRNEIKAEKNLLRYALFVSFFPQLVAGPIERSKNLLSQLAQPMKLDYEIFKSGIMLMLWGFFLKLVIADRIAIFVNIVYGNISVYPGIYLLIATILFSIQIYCDFYGYSIIALGTAKLLGINLMENFNAPYLSFSVSEFWKNWHISLTSWFRDYLYIPLGGSRKGTVRKYFNKIVVFLISGLWHGAAVSYLIWGFLNGVYQVIGEFLLPIRNKLQIKLGVSQNNIFLKIYKLIITFMLIDFSWIFFRATGFLEAIEIIESIAQTSNFSVLFDGGIFMCGLDVMNFSVLLFAIIILILADLAKNFNIKIHSVILQQNYWVKCVFLLTSICIIIVFGVYGATYDASSFIYFQF